MNTNPDDLKLAMWLDGELQGDDLSSFEAWLAQQPNKDEHLAARDAISHWKQQLTAVIPASEEPPYPDFFNHRIASAIESSSPAPAKPTTRFTWKSLWMPTTACAGMILAFWLGTRSHSDHLDIDVTGAPKAIPVEPILYTPENGVVAECFSSSGAKATVIVLNGVNAIPDDTDFSHTAALETTRETDSTAANSSH